MGGFPETYIDPICPHRCKRGLRGTVLVTFQHGVSVFCLF